MPLIPRRIVNRLFFGKEIEGEHAKIRIETKGKLKGYVRRFGKVQKREYSLSMAMAHVMFPENFPKPIASGDPAPKQKSINRQVTYSEPVLLDDQSQRAIEDIYEGMKENKIANEVAPEHMAKLGKHGIYEGGQRQENSILHSFESAGIKTNSLPTNVGFNVHGTPIFFEVLEINVSLLEKAIKKVKDPLRKKQAIKVLEGLKQMIPEKDHKYFVQVHN